MLISHFLIVYEFDSKGVTDLDLGLKGKNILITGAAKGIGRGIALAAAAEKWPMRK